MKTYLLYLLIPIVLVLFSQTPVQLKKEVVTKIVEEYNIDSLRRENESIKQEITKDTKVFKMHVDSANKITKAYIKDLKNIKIGGTFVPTDTLNKNTGKRKGWFKKIIDKIKNK